MSSPQLLTNVCLKNSLFSNHALATLLIFAYCLAFGSTASHVYAGINFIYFLSSMIFALGVFYIKDPELQKSRIESGVLINQITGSALVLGYILVFGVSSITLLSGFQLAFFMLAFVYAMSIMYMRDPEKLLVVKSINHFDLKSCLIETGSVNLEKENLVILIDELKQSLTAMMGFTELLMRRQDLTPTEESFFLNKIYERGQKLSITVEKTEKFIINKGKDSKESKK